MSPSSPQAAPSFKDHFSADAAAYSAQRPTYPAALFDWLAAVAPRRGVAWDVGCGGGQASLGLAERFRRVHASDPSAAQLAHAPAHPRIAYVRAQAEACPLADRTLDLILAAQAAHWFDLPAFYAQVARAARPGALLALVSYGPIEGEGPIGDALARVYHGRLHDHWPPERAHVEDGYRRLPFPYPEIAAPALAIAVQWPLERLVGYIGTWSATAAFRRATGEDPLPAVRATLSAAWPQPETPQPFRFPLAIRAGRAPA
ncbi:MAG: class I SAM-dependent methyltransferase [Nitratireductor sp.]